MSVVTAAVRLPAVIGIVENVMVREVGLAAVTLPTAPSLNTTVSLSLFESKPKPLMVMVPAFAGSFAAFDVITGATDAT